MPAISSIRDQIQKKALENIKRAQEQEIHKFDKWHKATSLEVREKIMKNTHHMRANLEPKWLGPYTTVEVKERGGNMVKDKYSKLMKRETLLDQVKLYFDQEIKSR